MTNQIHGPQGIRVWQGYRSESYQDNRTQFIKDMADLFIPITIQMLEPAGLRSCFSTILPDSKFTLPDEISLVSYDSQVDYYEVVQTTSAGRSYSALQQSAFNFSAFMDIPKSKSNFPIAFERYVECGQAYYLCDDEINWRDNYTSVYCAKRLSNVSSQEMLNHIETVIPVWQQKNTDVNGSVLVCEKDFILYWEHSASGINESSLSSLFPLFAPVLERPVISGTSLIRNVPPLNTKNYNGLSVNSGESLDIRLMDHTLYKTAKVNLNKMSANASKNV